MPGIGVGLGLQFPSQISPGGTFVPPPPPKRESFAILFSSDPADVITDGQGNAIEFRRSP